MLRLFHFIPRCIYNDQKEKLTEENLWWFDLGFASPVFLAAIAIGAITLFSSPVAGWITGITVYTYLIWVIVISAKMPLTEEAERGGKNEWAGFVYLGTLSCILLVGFTLSVFVVSYISFLLS